jgi:hypothetical protein
MILKTLAFFKKTKANFGKVIHRQKVVCLQGFFGVGA